MQNARADLLIEARWILPMTQPGLLLEHHTLVIGNGRILALLPQAAAAAQHPDAVRIQRPAHLLMPGLVNAHTHAGMSLFRGFAEGLPLKQWLHEKIWPLERRFVDASFVRDGALLSIAEMLSGGVTCFGDMYFFPNETAAAAAEQGIRALIGMPVADLPSPWAQTPAEYLSKALSVRDEFKGHPRIGCAFAPHAPYTVGDDTFMQIRTLADELDAGVMIHLHESAYEVGKSCERHGLRPIERLERLGMLTPALNAVHMAHVNAADIDLAQRSGISVTLCAESNLKLGNGAPPVAAWSRTGVPLGLGSDGPASNNDQDLWIEMRLAALLARSATDDTAPITPWQALAMATRGGAAALGLGDQIGTLEAGKWADVCCVDFDHPAMQPVHDPCVQLVYSGGRDQVSDVWVAGRQLLADGALLRLDWPSVRARAQEWARRLSLG
jgi:5-methylthioadenosine/S-adenosylhomocysteine deaminase